MPTNSGKPTVPALIAGIIAMGIVAVLEVWFGRISMARIPEIAIVGVVTGIVVFWTRRNATA